MTQAWCTGNNSILDTGPGGLPNGIAIGLWNTALVSDFSDLFLGCSGFDDDMSKWATSQVTDMTRLFSSSTGFPDDVVSAWDVGSVTDFDEVFSKATWNPNVVNWNTRSAIKFRQVFAYATSLNYDIGKW